MIQEFNSKPRILLDLSWIRANIHSFLDPDFNYVLTDTVIREICSTKSASVEKLAFSFFEFLDNNRNHIFIGKYWQDVSRSEIHPRYGTEAAGAIAWQETKIVRTASPSRSELISNIQGLEVWIDDHESEGDDFVRLFERRTSELEDHEAFTPAVAQVMRDSQSERISYIQTPTAIQHIFPSIATDRHKSPDWESALLQFPDVHAIGRWLRILAWYEMMHAIGFRKGFRNNFEDAAHLFSASYCDGLITGDNQMTMACKAMFPNVHVATTPETIKSLILATTP